MSAKPGRNGFSLIEVIIALVILTVGVLAMASATGYFFTQIQVSDASTDRTMAVQAAVEDLRARRYDSIASRAEAQAVTRAGYKTWHTVGGTNTNLREITVYTRGRGYVPNQGWSQSVLDSFKVSIARNMQPR